jgi:hypothetical protein
MNIYYTAWQGLEESMNAAEGERIYVVVAETVQVPFPKYEAIDRGRPAETVLQVPGRMAAQACHAAAVYGTVAGEVFTAFASLGMVENAKRVFNYLPLWTPRTVQ